MTGETATLLWGAGALALFALLAVIWGGARRMSDNLRNMAVWVLIFLGAILVYSARDRLTQQFDTRAARMTDAGVEILRGADGHFRVTLGVNGVPVAFIIDTGASQIVLAPKDARRAGIDPDALAYFGLAETANGTVRMARVTLETVTLGTMTARNIAASVNQVPMSQSLLGMTYLNRFSEISIRRDRMVLVP